MTCKVRPTRDAESDLERLFDFPVERELAHDGGDLHLPEQAMVALRAGIATLQSSPFTCRKAGNSPFLRELITPFGQSGRLEPHAFGQRTVDDQVGAGDEAGSRAGQEGPHAAGEAGVAVRPRAARGYLTSAQAFF